MNTDLTTRSVRLAWRCSIVNWLIGIQVGEKEKKFLNVCFHFDEVYPFSVRII